jgi:4a-hydroxytetrahydrobiopterin dehydratase
MESMTNLQDAHCVPCEGGTKALSMQQAKELLKQVEGWAPGEDGKWIVKQFKFRDFVEAMNFANKITPVAEKEGHHPDVHISFGKVVVELSTHSINGLSQNDFILASKIDAL